jgi:hypothetical protein
VKNGGHFRSLSGDLAEKLEAIAGKMVTLYTGASGATRAEWQEVMRAG